MPGLPPAPQHGGDSPVWADWVGGRGLGEKGGGGAGCSYVTMLRASAGAMGNAIENVLLPVSLWQEEVTK